MVNKPGCLLLMCDSKLHLLVPIVSIFFPYRKKCVRNQATRSFFMYVPLEVEDIRNRRNSILREWRGVGWVALFIPGTTLAQRRADWGCRARWEAIVVARVRERGLEQARAIGLENKLTGTGKCGLGEKKGESYIFGSAYQMDQWYELVSKTGKSRFHRRRIMNLV